MPEKIIVILGITGAQGTSVANTFLTLPSWKIRGITRNATKPNALFWASKGVSIFQADINNPSTLQEAFTGATIIFANTNFWEPFYNPTTRSLLNPGQSVPEYCYEQEVQQIKNIGKAASQVQGLERLVVSSLVDAERWSGGKYTGVWHFNSKARGVEFVRDSYPDLAEKMSTVIVGSYMENWRGQVKLIKGPDEAYRLPLPGTGLKSLPMTDVGSDLGNVVHAAIQVEPGKNILAASRMISWTDMLRIWCDINQVKFGGFDSCPVEVFASFIPVPDLGMEIGEMMAFMDEFGYDGGDPSVVLASDLGVPCSLTSWEEFVKKQDWEKVLSY